MSGQSRKARSVLFEFSNSSKISLLQNILQKPSKIPCQAPNPITATKQTTSSLQKSYLESTTIELEIKKASAKKAEASPLNP
jgi:hypothetical protein